MYFNSICISSYARQILCCNSHVSWKYQLRLILWLSFIFILSCVLKGAKRLLFFYFACIQNAYVKLDSFLCTYIAYRILYCPFKYWFWDHLSNPCIATWYVLSNLIRFSGQSSQLSRNEINLINVTSFLDTIEQFCAH